DGQGNIINGDSLPERVGSQGNVLAHEALTNNRNWLTPLGAILFWEEESSPGGFQAQHVKIVCRNQFAIDSFNAIIGLELQFSSGEPEESGKDLVLGAVVGEVWIGKSVAYKVRVNANRSDTNQFPGILHWQRSDQQLVCHTKDRCVGSDPQCQRSDRDSCEARMLQQATDSELEVFKEHGFRLSVLSLDLGSLCFVLSVFVYSFS